MKIILAVCIVVAASVSGHLLAASAERRKRLLGELFGALKILRIHIVNASEPLNIALIQTNFPLFVLVSENLATSASVSEAWKIVRKTKCRRGGVGDCLAQQEIESMDRLFNHLGRSARSSQQESINACIASIEDILAEAGNRAEQVKKLYSSIGFLTGLAIVVMMI